jgi:ATP-dependent Clp protease ATP-binding subunit ClpB
MQPDKFTQKSQEAIAATLELARSHRNPEATPAHLLVALLDQTEGLVVPILQRVGADTATIAARASEAVAQLPKLGGESTEEPRLSSGLAAPPSAKWGATGRA